jgi:hypothetical protein
MRALPLFPIVTHHHHHHHHVGISSKEVYNYEFARHWCTEQRGLLRASNSSRLSGAYLRNAAENSERPQVTFDKLLSIDRRGLLTAFDPWKWLQERSRMNRIMNKCGNMLVHLLAGCTLTRALNNICRVIRVKDVAYGLPYCGQLDQEHHVAMMMVLVIIPYLQWDAMASAL